MFTKHFDYLYVEPSSYCNLKCPRCPRTYKKESYTVTHMDKTVLRDFLSSPLWKDVKTVEFGGNYGDPLMHPCLNELIEVVKEKSIQAEVIIHTSGSHSRQQWNKVIDALSNQDTVLMSIDGLEGSNHLYRVGAQWNLIVSALQECSKKVKTIWKFIVFKHNQHEILEAIKFAKEQNVSQFLLTKSSVFYNEWADAEGGDSFAPDDHWVFRGESNAPKKIDPKCQIGSRHYLAADHTYSPCCWSNFDKKMKFQLNETSHGDHITELMQSERLTEIKNSWNRIPEKICRSQCRSTSMDRSSHQQLLLDLTQPMDSLNHRVNEFAYED